MKKLVLIFGMVALVFSQSMAQEIAKNERKSWTPEERAEKMTSRMALELELDEKQQKEIYAVNLRRANDMQAHREEMKSQRGQMKEKQSAYQAEIEKSLTEEQKAKLAEKKESRKSEYSDRKRGQGHKYHGKRGQRGGQHYKNKQKDKN
jgi:periplasmic protein CpxP/Spy